MLILIDIHRNILSAQAVFKCCANYAKNLDITLEPERLCISFSRDSSARQFTVKMPENFLYPHSVSLAYCKSPYDCTVERESKSAKLKFSIDSPEEKDVENLEIKFRFKIACISVIENCILEDPPFADGKDIMYNRYKAVDECNFICTGCGSILTEHLKFSSVYKYHEGMSELAETSFCHKHEEICSASGNTDSMYIGDMHFYFHHSVLKDFSLSDSGKTYKCIKCSSVLSSKKKMDNLHYIGFFSDKIMLKECDTESCDVEKYKFDTCLLSISTIIHDLLKASVSIKMYLQCKVHERTEVLLLWINSQKVVQFLVDGITDEDAPSETEFKGREVFKLLYCVCSPESELSKKWKHDFGVEFFQVSDNLMHVLRDLLQKSSKYFPENQETVKEFSFGYLPASVPVL